MLAPWAEYRRLRAGPSVTSRRCVLFYIVFLSVLTGAAAAYSATGRITLSLAASLGVTWMFLPILHVLIARALMRRHVGLFLMGHAPWSIWIVAAAVMTGSFGYAAYWWMLLLAVVPIALTLRIVHAFAIEVLALPPRAAIGRTLLHQAATWLVAAIYLDRAVGLTPRIQGLFS